MGPLRNAAPREPPLRGGRQRRVRYLFVIWLLLLVADGCGLSGGAEHSGSLMVMVTAGPTCPVHRAGDPACAPRPVKGAQLSLNGVSKMTLTTDANGTARETMIGAYRLVAQPVNGLKGTPAPLEVVITRRKVTHVTISYDTGIR
jgi:hypothetical protein